MLKSWTINRAAGTGIVAGLIALILWPVFAAWQEPVRPFYLAALGITAFCGLSILAISIVDLLIHTRGKRMVSVRTFDIVLALLLAGLAGSALYALLR